MSSVSNLRTLLTDWRYYPKLASLVFIFELLLGVAILTFARGTLHSYFFTPSLSKTLHTPHPPPTTPTPTPPHTPIPKYLRSLPGDRLGRVYGRS